MISKQMVENKAEIVVIEKKRLIFRIDEWKRSLLWLLELKKLYQKGMIRQSAYYSIKATTRAHRKALQDAIGEARQALHQAHVAHEDIMQKELKQSEAARELAAVVSRLSTDEVDVLKAAIKNGLV